MREDLNKQLCERNRHGSQYHFGEHRRNRTLDAKFDDMYEDDEAGTYATGGARESMKRRHNWHWNQKTFNEHLSPLYGNIRKAVGRKWDDFFSELNEVFDTRSVINRHILLHLYDRIAVDNVFYDDDGELMYRSQYSQDVRSMKDSGPEFYVDPNDGIIKHNKPYKSWRTERRERVAQAEQEKLKTRRVIDKDTELHKINDVWYEVKFRHFTTSPEYSMRLSRYYLPSDWKGSKHMIPTVRHVYPPVYDVLKKVTVTEAKVAVEKRTLSRKELKKYGLV